MPGELRTQRQHHDEGFQGNAHFFTLLRKSDDADALPGFLSDHPSTAARAAMLQTTHDGDPALTPAAWADVRTVCR